jgi:hypothetical protein
MDRQLLCTPQSPQPSHTSFVDDHGGGGGGQRVALAAAAFFGGAGLVVDDDRGAFDFTERTLNSVQFVAVVDGNTGWQATAQLAYFSGSSVTMLIFCAPSARMLFAICTTLWPEADRLPSAPWRSPTNWPPVMATASLYRIL